MRNLKYSEKFKTPLAYKGFTLVELMVVMVIIAILAGISIFAVQGARAVARDGRRRADLEVIRGALEMYRADCNNYPNSVLFGTGGIADTGTHTCVPSGQTYLTAVPNDPLAPSATYTYTGGGTIYTLSAILEDSTVHTVTNP